MKNMIYRTAAVMIAAAMLSQTAGCGCGKKSDTASADQWITDYSSVDRKALGLNTYKELLRLIQTGRENGWTDCAPAHVGLGSFAEDPETRIGYLVTDLDHDKTEELLLARLTEEAEPVRISSIYTIEDDGSVRCVYSGLDDTEMVILKKDVYLVRSLTEVVEDTRRKLTDEQILTVKYMTHDAAERFGGYLVQAAGLTEDDAREVVLAITGQTDTYKGPEWDDKLQEALVIAYEAAVEDGPIACAIPEEYQEILDGTETETREASERDISDGKLYAGAWIYKDGQMSETSMPDKIQAKTMGFERIENYDGSF